MCKNDGSLSQLSHHTWFIPYSDNSTFDTAPPAGMTWNYRTLVGFSALSQEPVWSFAPSSFLLTSSNILEEVLCLFAQSAVMKIHRLVSRLVSYRQRKYGSVALKRGVFLCQAPELHRPPAAMLCQRCPSPNYKPKDSKNDCVSVT